MALTGWHAAAAIVLAAVAGTLAYILYRLRRAYPLGWGGAPPSIVDRDAAMAADAAWDGARAMADIAALLRHAPRSPGTPGQAATLAYIEAELAKCGTLQVHRQSFTWHRQDGVELPLVNLVARWNPDAKTRILLGTHHDSLVRAYRDDMTPHAPMPGANNSGSGVAILLETARALTVGGGPNVGVDLVFFDGEEGPYGLGGGDAHWFPLGSPEFVRRLEDFYRQPPAAVVIIDLVGQAGLRLHPETNSLVTGRGEARRMWRIGKAVSPATFGWRRRGSVGDDHTAFWRAGIPAILLIGQHKPEWFDTTGDTLDKCRAESLSAVGRTLTRYAYSFRQPR